MLHTRTAFLFPVFARDGLSRFASVVLLLSGLCCGSACEHVPGSPQAIQRAEEKAAAQAAAEAARLEAEAQKQAELERKAMQRMLNRYGNATSRRHALPAAGFLKRLYADRGYALFWDAPEAQAHFFQLWSSLPKRGLDTALLYRVYPILLRHRPPRPGQVIASKASPEDRAARTDLCFSAHYLLALRSLCHGLVPSDTAAAHWHPTQRVEDWSAFFKRGMDSLGLEALLDAGQPKHPPYRFLVQAHARFLEAFPAEGLEASVPTWREDSAEANRLTGELLLQRGWLDSTALRSDSLSHSPRDSMMRAALKRFQRMHGLAEDGLVGRYTAEVLGQSNQWRLAQLYTTLDRWRHEAPWSQPFAWVPMPLFHLWIVDEDTLLFQHRVVVGTKDNPTPEISSNIDLVVAYPYWFVPYSISSKELLPKARSDSSYLVRNGYTLKDRSGQTVDPAGVDWTGIHEHNFPYTIRQEGGWGNALGLVKFIFPNPHAVYLHDTNAKRFFDKERRSYSHGCVRLSRPMDFAAYLIGRDSTHSMADVQRAIREKKQAKLALRRGLPVYLRHMSVVAGGDSLPIFGPDLYGQDAAWRASWVPSAMAMDTQAFQLQGLDAVLDPDADSANRALPAEAP
jgi:murein L,D-transpeptidase YcbB/YkuD